MDKCREAFEKAFPIPAHWIEFNEKLNKYHCPYCADYGASMYQAKWEAWQHQQKRIDELQARVHAQKKHIKTALIAVEDIHKSAMNELHEWDVLKEKVPKLCEHLQNLSVAVGELEEALKGGEV